MVYFNNTMPKFIIIIFSYCGNSKSWFKKTIAMFLKNQDFSIDQMLSSLFLCYLDKNPSNQLNHQLKIIVSAMLNMYFEVFDEYRSCTFQIAWDNHNSISFLFPPEVWKVFLCLRILKSLSLSLFKNAGFFIMVANRVLL